MTARRKDFSSRRPRKAQSTVIPLRRPGDRAIVRLPRGPQSVRTINLSAHLGHGYDDIVDACVDVLRTMLKGRHAGPASVAAYGRSGLLEFFAFLRKRGSSLRLKEIDRRLIEDYIAWLRLKGSDHPNTGRAPYMHTKAVLSVLARRNAFPEGMDVFPRNVFPRSNYQARGETRLSMKERQRVAEALRGDLIAIAKGRFQGSDLQAVMTLVLSVALRTGLNTTPAIELLVDCMKPHPLVKGQYLLESVKRRARKVQRRPVRAGYADSKDALAAGDVAAVVKFAVDRSEALRTEAPASMRERLWLFRTEANSNRGRVTALDKSNLDSGVRAFVSRHDLKGDDGKPLRLNMGRLRKTMANRLWRLSSGDLRGVARAMGNLPRVTDDHYLEVTPEMERNHKFLGEALVDRWRGVPEEESADLQNTPLGRCKDPFKGDLAPKDGTACMDFMSCFRCKSYVLVEDPRDLHRLFSFYFFLERERSRIRANTWAERYGWIMKMIDAVTADQFDPAMVSTAKVTAREQPLRFWRDPAMSGVVIDGS